jgi:hypothetical protein
MARKTIEVDTIREMTNHFLANQNTNADERQAVADMLESVLQQTGNYKGYRCQGGGQRCGTRRHYF